MQTGADGRAAAPAGSFFLNMFCRVSARRTVSEFVDLLHKLIEDVLPGQFADRLAVDKEQGLALAPCDADVGFPGLAGAVDTQPMTATLMDFL